MVLITRNTQKFCDRDLVPGTMLIRQLYLKNKINEDVGLVISTKCSPMRIYVTVMWASGKIGARTFVKTRETLGYRVVK